MGVQSGKAKWTRRMQTAGPKYNAAKGRMVSSYQESLRSAGVTVGPETLAAYQAGIAAANLQVGPEKADKWERNYLAAMAR